MHTNKIASGLAIGGMLLLAAACSLPPALTKKTPDQKAPAGYSTQAASADTTNSGKIRWREFFTDQYLVALIDTALKNNQELNVTMLEMEIARNEVRARKGEYLPFFGLRGAAGIEKVGRYTNIGASEATTEIKPGKETPEPLPDYMIGAFANWEIDIWKKLRNAKKAALTRYFASVEGRNFMVTNVIAEIANSYYELLALDKQLAIIKQNIELQTDALEIVRLQKQTTRVTELAVRRFEAQVLSTRSLQFDIQQRIVEAENRINFLVGRFPQPVQRSTQDFSTIVPATVTAGVPAQLLANRPDIKQAELQLTAAKLDVKSARANFYPSLAISAGIGFQAFNPSYLVKTPESLIYSLVGDLMAPLVNRNAIKATYYNATAKQLQAVYDYQRTVLNAYIEVANQVSNVSNLQQSYNLKAEQVQALNQSITISNNLFRSARADYMEVLLTQRDALEARFELIETKLKQMSANVTIYRSLGGGWQN